MSDAERMLDALKRQLRGDPQELKDHEKSRNVSESDREALLKFDRRMQLLDSKYSDYRREKLLRHCTRIAENVRPGVLTDSLESRKAAEDIVLWIKSEYDNENTKHDYRTALRIFGKRVTEKGVNGESDRAPASIDWVDSGTSSSHNPVPDPADMLEWETDVKPMIKATQNARDAALIAVAFDAGARSGELKDLTVGNVSDHEHGLQIRVDGKRGQRSVPLIPSVPYLQQWLHGRGGSAHPAPDNPDAPLWSKLSSSEPLTYRRFNDVFKDAAERAGVVKTVTPTNFRKSNATFLAREGMNQAYIEDRQGRVRGSDATAHYVARFGGESDSEYAKVHGVKVEEDDTEPFGPIDCPRCEKETPRDEPKCVWCGQVLDYDAIPELEAQERKLRDAVYRLAGENPEMLDDVRRARDLMTVFEDNPDLFEDAQGFVEALSDE
ncbi:tyrosine-type recombinase/integrase [Halococcus hamelinensis]|uniref:Integrase family protein n=1 Tax=Halococcus hamelinensis 100A6 TaxID=1132509 RepID=M0M5I5_9EURY|nr:site-specific integrase [Halococcus hamelinensis]EMA41057.1 integrase family protein [Halococcus hamelinensis 100A6]